MTEGDTHVLMRLRHDERGIAMVTALLVSMIVLALGVTAAGLSLHNSTASALDRKLTFAIQSFTERLAFHVRHHVPELSVALSRIEQRQEIRVLQLGGDAYFG